jgi:hypothetical protein
MIQCPARYAYGGQEVYGHFDSFKIPENTDLDYELTVINCEHDIDVLNKKNLAKKTHAP